MSRFARRMACGRRFFLATTPLRGAFHWLAAVMLMACASQQASGTPPEGMRLAQSDPDLASRSLAHTPLAKTDGSQGNAAPRSIFLYPPGGDHNKQQASGRLVGDTARIFISGHSLIDNPIPRDMANIAESLGTRAIWNRQYVVGSSIRMRTRGLERDDLNAWSGYRQGYNREGEGLNVIQELRIPRTIDGGPYDILLITERTGVVSSLLLEDTVRHLRHFHERIIEGNPQATTYFYHPWSSLALKNDPASWIAFERAASQVWQCATNRINRSLQIEGRPDRVISLPANVALIELIERALQPSGLKGVSAANVRETVDRILHDDIHLTRMGAYYMALVTYATMYKRSPVGAWAPAMLTSDQARSLQVTAWEVVTAQQKLQAPLSLPECRQLMVQSFCKAYWDKESPGTWGVFKKLRHAETCRYRFWRETTHNPFHYDPATDKSYWYEAP